MEVFLLWHVHKFIDCVEHVTLVGIYSSQENARDALRRVQGNPGFYEAPEGFEISKYIVDNDSWTGGYVTV